MSHQTTEPPPYKNGDQKMTTLQEITERMLQIEQTNISYNKATYFGRFPNGQEEYISLLLEEWDDLKALRNKLKILK